MQFPVLYSGTLLFIILYIILPIFIVELAVTIANSYSNYLEFKSVAEGKFVSDTELIGAKISAENTRGVALAKSSAESASILFGQRAESVRLIKDVLTEFPNFVGASIGYEVNADFADFRTELGLKNLRDGKDVKADGGVDAYNFAQNKTNVSMDEWVAKSEGGRFVAYWTRAKGELVLEPLTGMDTAMYSTGLRKKLEAGDSESFIVTEPYMYSNNVMMVEYSAPIFNEGKFCGQVAFDRDLTSIASLINSMKNFKGGDVFLISSQGRIISATKNENLRTLLIDDLLTDENGNFAFADVPVGKYKLYTVLDDESQYVFRDVEINENVAGDAIGKYEFAAPAAGTYYLGSKSSGINLYYIAILYTPENHAHECNNRCPDCGKCLNEACTEELCIEKCSCHKCQYCSTLPQYSY